MAGKKKNIAADTPKWEDVPEIPKDEQPYPLPEGWKWVRLGNLYQINPKVEADDSTLASFVPMEKIDPGMKGNFIYDIQRWGKIKKGHTQFADGDVAFAKISPCFENGKSMLVNGLMNGIGAGTTELIILRNKNISQKFTFYIISSEDFIKKGIKTYSGTVGQQRINMNFVYNYLIPLPPLEIQQRIVARIESLFSRLDEAAAKVQAVIDSHEARKQAILHKAFSGELTKKWRKENGVSLDSWEEKTLQEVCAIPITDGTHQTPTYSDKYNGIPFLSSKDVTKGYIDWDHIKYITKELHNILYKRIAPKQGDILLAKNGTTGVAALVTEDRIFDIYVTLALLRPNINIINRYFLLYIINSYICKIQFNNKLTGIGLPNLHLCDIKKVFVPIPTLNEQEEIVHIIIANINKLKYILKICNLFLDKIKYVKSKILKLAFSGRLVL